MYGPCSNGTGGRRATSGWVVTTPAGGKDAGSWRRRRHRNGAICENVALSTAVFARYSDSAQGLRRAAVQTRRACASMDAGPDAAPQRQVRAKMSHGTPARYDSKRAPMTPPHFGRMPLPCTVMAIVVALAQQATLALRLLETTANVVAIAQTRLTNDPHLCHLLRLFLKDSSPRGCPSKASFLRHMNESPYRGTPTDTRQGTREYTDTWHILAR